MTILYELREGDTELAKGLWLYDFNLPFVIGRRIGEAGDSDCLHNTTSFSHATLPADQNRRHRKGQVATSLGRFPLSRVNVTTTRLRLLARSKRLG
jgi:hypothetical protein